MGIELKKKLGIPTYNDGRVFDWKDFSYYLTLEEFTVMNRSGDYWEVFYKLGEPDCQRLSSGSKEFCMRSVEHEIRRNER